MRTVAICVVVLCQWLSPVFAQDANSNSATTVCTFEDGQQVSVQYNNSATPVEEPHNGKPWRPAGSPMILFTQTALTINKVEIAPGAYSLWLIPDKKNWTLVVNKNVKPDSAYDATEDLVREPMDLDNSRLPLNKLTSDSPICRPNNATCEFITGGSGLGAISTKSRLSSDATFELREPIT